MNDIATTNPGQIVSDQISESSALVSMIERAARDPNVDIDKMERLFQMHERMAARSAEQAYNEAMAKAQAAMPAVVRNKKNEHTKARYADLYAIADAAMPEIHKAGFGLSFSECEAMQPGCIGIACRVSHSAGHSETYRYNVPLDKAGTAGKTNKTDTQAYGSTMTYGRRYATCGVFNISITDDDGNAASETITEDQADMLSSKLADADADIPAFCRFFKIDKYADLPAAKLSSALRMIDQRKQKAASND